MSNGRSPAQKAIDDLDRPASISTEKMWEYLRAGKEVNLVTQYFAFHPKSEEALRQFDPNGSGNTPLHYAISQTTAENKYNELAADLVGWGANPTVRNASQKNAFELANEKDSFLPDDKKILQLIDDKIMELRASEEDNKKTVLYSEWLEQLNRTSLPQNESPKADVPMKSTAKLPGNNLDEDLKYNFSKLQTFEKLLTKAFAPTFLDSLKSTNQNDIKNLNEIYENIIVPLSKVEMLITENNKSLIAYAQKLRADYCFEKNNTEKFTKYLDKAIKNEDPGALFAAAKARSKSEDPLKRNNAADLFDKLLSREASSATDAPRLEEYKIKARKFLVENRSFTQNSDSLRYLLLIKKPGLFSKVGAIKDNVQQKIENKVKQLLGKDEGAELKGPKNRR